jgi:hypothetical protein
MALPEYTGCSSCGDSVIPDQDTSCNDCESTSGKLYDKLKVQFTLQKAQTESKIYVCDAARWSSCMWLAVCGGGKIAALKITGFSLTNNTLTVFNGCQGADVPNQPTSGTTFDEGSVIYPIFPRCDDPSVSFCARVASCVSSLESICFTKVPEADVDIENHHLFAGTYGEGQETSGDVGFWASCLRKLKQVYAGMFGRTFCFLNIPTTTDADTIVGETTYRKYFVYYDSHNKCIKRGPAVGESTICNASSLDLEDDEYKFDKVIVCKEGVKKSLTPICGYTLVAKNNDAGSTYWAYEKLKNFEILPAKVVLRTSVSLPSTAGTFNYPFDLEDEIVNPNGIPCWANYAVCALGITAIGANSTSSRSTSARRLPTDTHLAYVSEGGASDTVYSQTEVDFPIIDGKINIKLVTGGSGTSTWNLTLVGWKR